MAKLLKEVWKTFYGAFFETQEEAAEAERDHRISLAIEKAYNASIGPVLDEYKARVDKDRLGLSGHYTERHPHYRYNLPPNFNAHLLEALQEQGVIADPILIKEVA